jgi:hypothetical protein
VRRFPSHRLFDKLKSIIPHTSNTRKNYYTGDYITSVANAKKTKHYSKINSSFPEGNNLFFRFFLQALNAVFGYVCNFFKHTFTGMLMFCFLGISNRGDIIPGIIVLPKYIRKANDLMIELDKLWDGFETRRLMFYYVAKARLAELEEELEFATECKHVSEETNRKIQTYVSA